MAYYTLNSYRLRFEPFEIFEALKNEGDAFFLDSSLNSDSSGRYSFLGIDPFFVLETKERNPFKDLRKVLDRYRISLPKNYPPFCAGGVGYLSYDLGFLLENRLKRNKPDDLKIPECYFGFYNTAIIIDNTKRILHIFTSGLPETKYYLAKSLCEKNLKGIQKLLYGINSRKSKQPAEANNRLELKSNFTKDSYILAVKKGKEYIKNGDIYQLNLSQRFQAINNLAGFEIYKRLRKLSPSFFSAYLDTGSFQILSSSPERFLRLDGDNVITCPMKGTRKRSKNKSEDERLKNELLNSAKDKAELMMIVDLERNDLGRVCEYDSIKVNALRELEEYSTVFQTTATISGKLHKGKDRIDLLRACFPGGSITGCPKIRAMEIIEELEPNRRSIYTGCLGYLSFSGSMDLNILIRTIFKKNDKIYFGVGGGIVADSKPLDEYEETLVKAKAIFKTLGAPLALLRKGVSVLAKRPAL